MKQVLVFLINGFEEVEALAAVDILRRGNVLVKTVSLETETVVVGGHNVPVVADMLFNEIQISDVHMLFLPGGTPRLNEHKALRKLVEDFVFNGGKVAAICAAPMVLGTLGLLQGKNATCYPGFEQYLHGAELSIEGVVVDGNIITGKGPAYSIEFALTVLEQITDKNNKGKVAAGLLYS